MNSADFLRDIFDDPNNDEPRLVFADWLEEHGQAERAEWIRVGCEIAKVDMGEEWDRLVDRRIELFKQCKPDYWEPITGVSDYDNRGLFMMETYKSPTATTRLGKVMWLEQARKDGWLEGLHIKNIGGDSTLKNWNQPALDCRLFLKPVPQIGDDDLAGFLEMPNLTGIELLHRIYEECPSIQRLHTAVKLEKLALEELRADEFCQTVFDQLPQLTELRHLELDGVDRPTDEDIRSLFSLKNLRQLEISSDALTDAIVVELQKFANLIDLTISCKGISNEAAEELRRARPDMHIIVWNE